MFLLPGTNIPTPLSRDEACKTGDWGGGCGKACPRRRRGGPRERRGHLRGGGRSADCPAHSARLCRRTRGGRRSPARSAEPSRTEGVRCPLRLQPFLPRRFGGPRNEPRGPNGKVTLFTGWEKKQKQNSHYSHFDQECWVAREKMYVKRIGRSKLFFQALC